MITKTKSNKFCHNGFAKNIITTTLLLTLASTTNAWAAEIVRGPYVQMATDKSMTIRWKTDVATNSQVSFGNAVDALSNKVLEDELTTDHEVNIEGLSALTRYYYSIGSSAEQLDGNNAETFFETSPTTGEAVPTRIWILGDPGRAGDNPTTLDQKIVRDGYYNFANGKHTNFWMMLGDNAYPDGTIEEYQNAVFNQYPKMLKQSTLWPAMGNHDNRTAKVETGTGGYYDLFTMPTKGEAGGVPSNTEGYFSFDYGNIHVISLNSSDEEHYDVDVTTNADGSITYSGAPMAQWLEDDLASSNAEWLVVIFHHPVYGKSGHDSDTEYNMVKMREVFNPILEKHGVDLVMMGHNHFYTRTALINGHYGNSSTFDSSKHILNGGNGRIDGDGAYVKTAGKANDGTIYITHGASSGDGNGHAEVVTDEDKASGKRHPSDYIYGGRGSMLLEINNKTLKMNVLNPQGVVKDYFTIEHTDKNPPINIKPEAIINGPYVATTADEISFSSAGSKDSDGLISNFLWNFGDDTTSNEENPSHRYLSANDYTVTLQVRDNKGAVDIVTTTASITAGVIDNTLVNGEYRLLSGVASSEQHFNINIPVNATDLTFSLSDGSGDADLYLNQGLPASMNDFDCRPYKPGNNEFCEVPAVVEGAYHVMVRGYKGFDDVKLTVTFGLNNQPPIALISPVDPSTVGNLVSFQGANSTDPDGEIVSYNWDFANGDISSEINPNYIFDTIGTYVVSLTVEDDLGLTDTATIELNVTETDVNQTITDACLQNAEIKSQGKLLLDTTYCLAEIIDGGQLQFSYYVESEDVDKTLNVYTEHGEGNANIYHQYKSRPTTLQYDNVANNDDNKEHIQLSNVQGGWHYIHVRANDTFAGTSLKISFDNNQQPQADINGPYNSSISQAVTFSSAGSFDIDGNIVAYDWDFGDDEVSKLENPTHQYANSGVYSASLTVTDNQGISHTDTAQVIITSEPVSEIINACENGGSVISGSRVYADTAYCLANTSDQGQVQLSYMVKSENAGKNLEINLRYGDGNADMLYRLDFRPTESTYDKKSASEGNNETIVVESIQQGWSYIHIKANPNFSAPTLYLRYID
ncbi:PKD domain-containing protein [Colwellia psychrerythraea]|uniref:Metallophosphoesterase n=1 Tax=Colwellia psychrerythraea TaxID=28229 RepID=A0A099KLA3_COLPS|nr:PKD domain-containing protein [Colwellia psychrerythraea]KGJ91206.1 metallophosphoesterase [Colwellia psychrerythraea]